MSSVAAAIASTASHFSSVSRIPMAQRARALRKSSRTSLIPSPTGPEKNPTPRASSEGPGTAVSAGMGTLVTGSPGVQSREGAGVSAPSRPFAGSADLLRDALLCADEGPPPGNRSRTLRRAHPRGAEVLPDARHLRNVRHRNTPDGRLAERPQIRVLDLLAGDDLRRGAAV